MRDLTELQRLAGQEEIARSHLRLLYEASAAMTATLDVKAIAEALTRSAIPQFCDMVAVELEEDEEPFGAGPASQGRALRLGSRQLVDVMDSVDITSWHTGDLGVERLTEDLFADEPEAGGTAREALFQIGVRSLVVAPLITHDATMGHVAFCRNGQYTPFTTEDLGVVRGMAVCAAVVIDNARRYAAQRTTAITLQRYLLPQALPEVTAVSTASRYAPSQAQVAGSTHSGR